MVCAVLAPWPSLAQTADDILAVIETANALDHAVDAKDWDEAKSFFAEEITFSYGDAEPATMLSGDLVTMWSQNLYPAKTSFHLRGGHMVDFEGQTTATLYSKGYAYNHLEGFEGGSLWEVWGNYTYTLERSEGEWLITSFAFDPTHERGNIRIPSYRP
jgi:hypothetical protein